MVFGANLAVRIIGALLVVHYCWLKRQLIAFIACKILTCRKLRLPMKRVVSGSELLLRKCVRKQMGESRARRLSLLADWLRVLVILGIGYGAVADEQYHAETQYTMPRLLLALLWCHVAARGWKNLTHWSYGALHVVQILNIIAADRVTIVITRSETTIVRVMIGVIYADFAKSFFWNVVISLTLSVVHLQYPVPSCPDLADGPITSIAAEWATFTLIMMCSYLIQYWTEQHVRSALTERATEGARSAAHSILSVLCDAVVYLDSSLAAKLGYLLQRPTEAGGFSSLAGLPFVERVVEQDRKRFSDFISSTRTESSDGFEPITTVAGGPAVLHVSLLGRGQAPLAVELFHAYFPNLEAEAGHLVGIREVPEALKNEAAPIDSYIPEASSEETRDVTIPVQYSNLEGCKASSQSSASSSKSTHSTGTVAEEPFDMSLAIDVFTSPMKLQSWTLHFQDSSASQCHLTDLSQWLSDSGLQSWIQRGTNSLLHSGSAEELDHIKFQPPVAGMLFSETLMVKRAALELIDDDDDADGEVTGVAMHFQGIHRSKRRRRRRAVGKQIGHLLGPIREVSPPAPHGEGEASQIFSGVD